jgi:hypothetical protein
MFRYNINTPENMEENHEKLPNKKKKITGAINQGLPAKLTYQVLTSMLKYF